MNTENSNATNQEIEQEQVVSPAKRAFIFATVSGAAAAFAAGIGFVAFRYVVTGNDTGNDSAVTEVKIDGAAEMPANSSKTFKFGSKPSILIKDPAGAYFAYCSVCTHLGCNVAFQPDQERIFCACHGGVYDFKTGKNVSGPPPAPLSVYKVEVKPNGIYALRA